jgi:hypothetical protein
VRALELTRPVQWMPQPPFRFVFGPIVPIAQCVHSLKIHKSPHFLATLELVSSIGAFLFLSAQRNIFIVPLKAIRRLAVSY